MFVIFALLVFTSASSDLVKRDSPICGETGKSCYNPYRTVNIGLTGAQASPDVYGICSLLCKSDDTCASFAFSIGILFTNCYFYNGPQYVLSSLAQHLFPSSLLGCIITNIFLTVRSKTDCFIPNQILGSWVFYDRACPNLPPVATVKFTYTKQYTTTSTYIVVSPTTTTATKTAYVSSLYRATTTKVSTVTRTVTTTRS
ncbi:hypothetical protein BDV96DRAFT_654511 [Lophiotrema nucula]|uniref:Apple domain-containing protein n=1 Tax=Lophiotrema nucula TaxID=690887 RepID=A0A6A5YKK0_9PLEO|nr:hypothetical protein BDV96DRAFT_654511 [Lophiotrema nucula]